MVTLRNWLVNLDMRKNTQAVWITYGKIARTGQISNAQVYSINENRCEFELCSRSLWSCVCHQQHSLWRTSRLGASECSRSPCYRFRSKTVPSSSIAKSTKIYKFGIESNDQIWAMLSLDQCTNNHNALLDSKFWAFCVHIQWSNAQFWVNYFRFLYAKAAS